MGDRGVPSDRRQATGDGNRNSLVAVPAEDAPGGSGRSRLRAPAPVPDGRRPARGLQRLAPSALSRSGAARGDPARRRRARCLDGLERWTRSAPRRAAPDLPRAGRFRLRRRGDSGWWPAARCGGTTSTATRTLGAGVATRRSRRAASCSRPPATASRARCGSACAGSCSCARSRTASRWTTSATRRRPARSPRRCRAAAAGRARARGAAARRRPRRRSAPPRCPAARAWWWPAARCSAGARSRSCPGINGVSAFDVVRPGGSLIHHIELPRSGRCALAESRGLALIAAADGRLLAVDLRYGRVLGEEAGADRDRRSGHRRQRPLRDPGRLPPRGRPAARAAHPVHRSLRRRGAAWRARPPPVDAGAGEAPPASAAGPTPPRRPAAGAAAAGTTPDARRAGPPIPDVPLYALGSRAPPAQRAAAARRAAVRARPASTCPTPSIWSPPGRRAPSPTRGTAAGSACPTRTRGRSSARCWPWSAAGWAAPAELLAAADQRVEEAARRVGRRAQATLAAGRPLPFVELAVEFGLSDIASKVLAVAAAPTLRGEIARLYGVLANDEGRPICDRYLIELLLGGQDCNLRNQVAAELDADAPLVKYGLVRVLPRQPATSTCSRRSPSSRCCWPACAATRSPRAAPARWPSSAAPTARSSELAMPARRSSASWSSPWPSRPTPDRSVRLVLRGRPGAGPHHPAGRAGRAGRQAARGHRRRAPAARPGAWPAPCAASCASRSCAARSRACAGLELLDRDDSEGIEHVREVLRTPSRARSASAPAPSCACRSTRASSTSPCRRSARGSGWISGAPRSSGAGIDAAGAAALAARFRIGPGIIERVVTQVAAPAHRPSGASRGRRRRRARPRRAPAHRRPARQGRDPRRPARPLGAGRAARRHARQHPRVHRPRQPPPHRVRELGLRAAGWRPSRGLTALFYGPPGTGKTMVAGVIARELGARALPGRPLAHHLEVDRRDREEPGRGVRRRRGRPGDAAVRRGRLAVRQAHRGQVVGRSLRQPRGQLPAAAPRHASRASRS